MKPAILETEHGTQIIVSGDDRTENIRLAVWANRGSLGIELSKAEALRLSKALWRAVQ